jgi:predicted ATPase
LQTGVNELRGARFTQYKSAFLIALAEGLGAAGRLREAVDAITEGLQDSESSQERWCLPELLRVRGELEVLQGLPDAMVEATLTSSMEWARRQGALSWELRTATSLARQRMAKSNRGQARQILATVRDKFTEGFESPDMKQVDALLQDLSGSTSEVRPD